jgi:hypothetical protein
MFIEKEGINYEQKNEYVNKEAERRLVRLLIGSCVEKGRHMNSQDS